MNLHGVDINSILILLAQSPALIFVWRVAQHHAKLVAKIEVVVNAIEKHDNRITYIERKGE